MNSTDFKNNLPECRILLPICEVDAPLFLSAVYNKKYTSEKITSRCPQSGRSMIEMLGVLAIIGVLSVGGIAGYSKAMMKYRTNKTIEQVTLLMTNIRTFFKGKYDGVGDSVIMRKAKLVLEEMWDGNTIQNAFGGSVNFIEDCKTSACDSDFVDAVVINTDAIPQEACIEIATMDWRANSGNSLVNITVNGNMAESFDNYIDSCTSSTKVTCAKDMPMSIDNVATACNSSENFVNMKFY